MKQLIIPFAIIAALIVFFVIVDHKEFSRHDDIQTFQSESTTTNRQPSVSVPQTKFMTDVKPTVEAKPVEIKPVTNPVEGNPSRGNLVAEKLSANDKNAGINLTTKTMVKDNPPVAVPADMSEEVELANEETLKPRNEKKTAESNKGRVFSISKRVILFVIPFITIVILYIFIKDIKRQMQIGCFKQKKKSFIKIIFGRIVYSFLVLAFTCLLFFIIKGYLPRSEEIVLSYAIMNRIGNLSLLNEDIKDTRIYYATKEDPVLSERQTIRRGTLLPEQEDIFKREIQASLPRGCTLARIDLTYDAKSIANAKDDEYPEIIIKINGERLSKDKYTIKRWNLSSRVTFPVTITEEVLHSVQNKLQSVFFSIFLILLLVVAIAIKILYSQQRLQFTFLFCFFIMSLFPIVKFNLEKDSEQENRTLEHFPTVFFYR